MDIDPEDVFADDENDPENDQFQEKYASKELCVYLIDASPKMFDTTCASDKQKDESHFQVVVSSIAQSLKTQIINRSYDEVAICFFNTREKKNLQDLNGVYVFNVSEREDLDRPTAKLIKEFDCIEEKFSEDIGSKYGISHGSRDNSLYNALWVAQALLRKGSPKTTEKRMLLLTNEDDPFGSLKGLIKIDMMRTTMQRAKDAQDLGISIELLPLSRPDKEFSVTLFYSDLLGLEGDEVTQFKTFVSERFEDMKDQLRKRIFKKRKIRRVSFIIADGISIEVDTYALIRPTNPGNITWLDSLTNVPLKTERSFICGDTGALVKESPKRFQIYKNENVLFSEGEISEIKRVSTGKLRLIGFKPLSCLKDYHNLKPSTFIFPTDEEVIGSTCAFIALHRSMLRLKRFAVAFNGDSAHPRLVALVAQDEIISGSGQVEPPGMHMIYLPYSDDVRHVEELGIGADVLRATDEQVMAASALVRRVDLKDFSVCQFANPALQSHYAILQALALDEDEMPDIKDETVPDEEGMSRPGIVKALEDFKLSVFGQNYEEELDANEKLTGGSRKRKAVSDDVRKAYSNYDWPDLADNGRLKDLTVVELKYYLTAHNLPLTGNKSILIARILTHMGK